MTGSITKRIASAASASNTARVNAGDVPEDRYNAWGESWRLDGSIESSWGLSWIHRFARSVIGVTDRVGSTDITDNATKRVSESPEI